VAHFKERDEVILENAKYRIILCNETPSYATQYIVQRSHKYGWHDMSYHVDYSSIAFRYGEDFVR
jgi:hypothetical protein